MFNCFIMSGLTSIEENMSKFLKEKMRTGGKTMIVKI